MWTGGSRYSPCSELHAVELTNTSGLVDMGGLTVISCASIECMESLRAELSL